MLGSLIPKIDNFRTGAGIGPELLVNTDSELIIPKPTITYVGRKSFSVAGKLGSYYYGFVSLNYGTYAI